MDILVMEPKGQLGNEFRRLIETGDVEIGPVSSKYKDAKVDYVDYGALDITDSAAVGAWMGIHECDSLKIILSEKDKTHCANCLKRINLQ